MRLYHPQRPLGVHLASNNTYITDERHFLTVMEKHYAERKKHVKGFTGKNLIMNRHRTITYSLTNNTIASNDQHS